MKTFRATAVALLLVLAAAPCAPAGARGREVPPKERWDEPFIWHQGNLAWFEPMVPRAIEGKPLGVDAGFFDEGLRAKARMTPNHEAEWRALRYLAAVRGEGGDLARERRQIEAWFLRQRREGLQLDELGGYVQQWSTASAVAALAAWEDLAAHPSDAGVRRVTRVVLGWWRDFGAYYSRLRTPEGRLLRVGARQKHRPRDAAYDEVLVDLLLGPAPEGRSRYAREMAGRPEREWLRLGLGAWAAREVMERGVPIGEVARAGSEGPLPRTWNRLTVRPGCWAWMPQVDGRSPVRWASWIEDGEVRYSGQPIERGAVARSWSVDEAPRWDLAEGVTTGPDASLPPLPSLAELPGPHRRSAGTAVRSARPPACLGVDS